MSNIGTGYDLSVTTFSPGGRSFPIEYRTVVGMKCKDGVVMGVEKSIKDDVTRFKSKNSLHSSSFWHGVAGLAADGGQIVARAKSEATNYERPFGCGVILGGYERDGPQLYMIEHSGISYRYFGAAIGKGKQAAKTFRMKATNPKIGSPHSPWVVDIATGGNKKLERYAVVTGANKGIGFETVRQLAKSVAMVVLTARDEKRGMQAVASLRKSGLFNVCFHQLDVQSPESIASLAEFMGNQFGRLDILVNNAGASGVVTDQDALRALNIDPSSWLSGKATDLVQSAIITTNEAAEECLSINYYGCKRVTEALLPLLQLSSSGANIVNVSSLRGELMRIPNEHIREQLADLDTLTEEKIDMILVKFLNDLKQDKLDANKWQKMLPAYSISKAALNAYTRVVAKRYLDMRVNCVHPGYINTDINWHTGTMTLEEGAEGPVMLALLRKGGPTGCYFNRTAMAEF